MRLLVLGAGPVGILAAQVAHTAGAHVTLGGTTADEERLVVARSLGLDTLVVDSPAGVATLEAWGTARSVDVVVECAGVAAAVSTALRTVRPSLTMRGTWRYCAVMSVTPGAARSASMAREIASAAPGTVNAASAASG